MKSIHFIRNNHALAGVIEALLLVALVAIILSTIQLVYVPVIMEQKETEHMKTVENQVAHLKSVIETQAIMGVAGGGSPIAYSPMASPITLGSSELPYFISQGSFGIINIIDKDNIDQCVKIIVKDPDSLPIEYLEKYLGTGIPLTSIKYDAANYYFVDQNYLLEGGAIILEQPGQGNTIKVDVPMKVEDKGTSIKIFYTIPVFNAPINKDIISGQDTCFVRTNYVSHTSFEIHLVELIDDYLSIYTDYPNAWYESLVRDDSGILWEYLEDIKVTTDNSTYVKIERGGDIAIDVELTIVEIDIQVGTGYVIPNKD